MHRRTFILSAAAIAAAPALAAEALRSAAPVTIGSIEYAPELMLAGKKLLLNGAGLRKIVFF